VYRRSRPDQKLGPIANGGSITLLKKLIGNSKIFLGWLSGRSIRNYHRFRLAFTVHRSRRATLGSLLIDRIAKWIVRALDLVVAFARALVRFPPAFDRKSAVIFC
jgi:hypothetical protein